MRGCNLHSVQVHKIVWFLKRWDTNYETHCTFASFSTFNPFLLSERALCILLRPPSTAHSSIRKTKRFFFLRNWHRRERKKKIIVWNVIARERSKNWWKFLRPTSLATFAIAEALISDLELTPPIFSSLLRFAKYHFQPQRDAFAWVMISAGGRLMWSIKESKQKSLRKNVAGMLPKCKLTTRKKIRSLRRFCYLIRSFNYIWEMSFLHFFILLCDVPVPENL